MVIVRRVTEIRMVTKGYRKGVYDRVTEGTWEETRVGNQGKECLQRHKPVTRE